MSRVYLLVHQVLETGYLSRETEAQLQVLIPNCEHDDQDILMMLHHALVFGHVKRHGAAASSVKKSSSATTRRTNLPKVDRRARLQAV